MATAHTRLYRHNAADNLLGERHQQAIGKILAISYCLILHLSLIQTCLTEDLIFRYAPQALTTVLDVLGDSCEVPEELAGVCTDVMHYHGVAPGTNMKTLTALFAKLCIMGAAKEYYGPAGMYRVAINVLCDILHTRSSMEDDEFCAWAKDYVSTFGRFGAQTEQIVNNCLSELSIGRAKTLPHIFNLESYHCKTYTPVEHPDMPVVTVFADLKETATREDIGRVMKHLEGVANFRIPDMYVDVVTNFYSQRVILIKIPR
ncbi:hypothetical protein JKP88DRAFT_241080 [Tribonema minus]|uniref:Uncharacterized protein n=1 Tax=Tribonema minus TaxID=303371 RepID=A0A835Z3B1_9STRA|nr:hypothetical protein JKP88DRAFT_241080 [Tribonema minus]